MSIETGIVNTQQTGRYRNMKYYRFIFCITEKTKKHNCCCTFGTRYIIMLNRLNVIAGNYLN